MITRNEMIISCWIVLLINTYTLRIALNCLSIVPLLVMLVTKRLYLFSFVRHVILKE